MPGFKRAPLSMLSFGGHDPKLYRNAAGSGAHSYMADMEDACPSAQRGAPVRLTFQEQARGFRALLSEHGVEDADWLENVSFGARVNGFDTGLLEDDLRAVVEVASDVQFVVVPKVNNRDDINQVLAVLRGGGQEIALIAIVEHPRAFRRNNLDDIAEAIAGQPAGGGLLFGTLDYCSALPIRGWRDDERIRDQENILLIRQKSEVVEAAHAVGILAIDGVHLTLPKRDAGPERIGEVEAGLKYTTEGSAMLGFDLRLSIHPRQIRIAHSCYGHRPDAVRNAFRRLVLWVTKGGALADPEKGDMIDDASIRGPYGDLAIAEYGRRAGSAGTPGAETLPMSFEDLFERAHSMLGR